MADREALREAAPPAPNRSRRGQHHPWSALAVVLTGFFMILLDGTIMNVAIPPIQEDLGADYSMAQWMMTGYALAYGVLLIPAGRVGDRFGHKRLFTSGLACFTAASLLCAQSTSATEIVFWRVAQGMSAAMMNPSVLALIKAVFDEDRRGRAFAWYGATAGTAAALGPVLGGLIIAWDPAGLSWRPIFLLNIPVGLIVLVGALKVLPNLRGRGGSLDPVGAGLLAALLLLVSFPLIHGYENGWPIWGFVALATSPPVAAVFIGWQRRRLHTRSTPLLDIRLFTARSFAAGVSTTLALFIAFASLQFVLSAYLQLGLGASAAETGFALMPFAVGTFIGSSVSNMAVRALGRRALRLGSGLLCVGTAGTLVIVSTLGADVGALSLAPVTLISGIGAMLLGAPLLNIALTDVPDTDAGSAGGVLATAQRVGHALGIAVVGTALFASLPVGVRGWAPTEATREAFSHAMTVAISCCLAACVLTFLLVSWLPRSRDAES